MADLFRRITGATPGQRLLLLRNTDDFAKAPMKMENLFRKIIGATRSKCQFAICEIIMPTSRDGDDR